MFEILIEDSILAKIVEWTTDHNVYPHAVQVQRIINIVISEII